jgi:hypothetical protein
MPLIKKPKDDNIIAVTFRVPENLKNEIKSYCEFANIKEGYFHLAAAEHILVKDKEWKKFKKGHGLEFDKNNYKS